MLQVPLFKIRCSALGKIMVGALAGITEKQRATIVKLEAKEQAGTLTMNQQFELKDLREKRDRKPFLSAGAKTYVEEWLKSVLYDEPYEFTSKYTEKGTECEPEGIEMVARRMNYGLIAKNETRYENEWCTGEPDLVLAQIIEEVKCPYSSKTFPLFEDALPNTDYEWQDQGYMWLTDKPKAAVNYCLIDAPPHIIEQETRRKAYSMGIIDMPVELCDVVEAAMTFGNIPDELKHKRYEFERNETMINLIPVYVQLCREYIAELVKNIPGVSIQTEHSIAA